MSGNLDHSPSSSPWEPGSPSSHEYINPIYFCWHTSRTNHMKCMFKIYSKKPPWCMFGMNWIWVLTRTHEVECTFRNIFQRGKTISSENRILSRMKWILQCGGNVWKGLKTFIKICGRWTIFPWKIFSYFHFIGGDSHQGFILEKKNIYELHICVIV